MVQALCAEAQRQGRNLSPLDGPSLPRWTVFRLGFDRAAVMWVGAEAGVAGGWMGGWRIVVGGLAWAWGEAGVGWS